MNDKSTLSLQTQVRYRLPTKKDIDTYWRDLVFCKGLDADYRPWSDRKIRSDVNLTEYQSECIRFVKWCVSQGADEFAHLDDVRHLAEVYLQNRLYAGLAISTIKENKYALEALYRERIYFTFPGDREKKAQDLCSSHKKSKTGGYFSVICNRLMILFAHVTGGRNK